MLKQDPQQTNAHRQSVSILRSYHGGNDATHSKEVARGSNPPFFIKYLSILPYGGKVESLYREVASVAQFSRIEWPLIGTGIRTGMWEWGKGLLVNRNWRHLLIASGVSIATSAAAYAAFKYVIKPISRDGNTKLS